MATYRTGAATFAIQQMYYGPTGAALNTAGFVDYGVTPGVALVEQTDPAPWSVVEPQATSLVTDEVPLTIPVAVTNLQGAAVVRADYW